MWVVHRGLLLRLPWRTWICNSEGQVWRWHSCFGHRGPGSTRYSRGLAPNAEGNKWQPTPVFLPGESCGQRSLAGHGPWGCRELDMTEVTEHTHRRKYGTLEEYGNPLQYSHLENPLDREAWQPTGLQRVRHNKSDPACSDPGLCLASGSSVPVGILYGCWVIAWIIKLPWCGEQGLPCFRGQLQSY